jgi:hypothetical protein
MAFITKIDSPKASKYRSPMCIKRNARGLIFFMKQPLKIEIPALSLSFLFDTRG